MGKTDSHVRQGCKIRYCLADNPSQNNILRLFTRSGVVKKGTVMAIRRNLFSGQPTLGSIVSNKSASDLALTDLMLVDTYLQQGNTRPWQAYLDRSCND
jgi:hypothetical protein